MITFLIDNMINATYCMTALLEDGQIIYRFSPCTSLYEITCRIMVWGIVSDESIMAKRYAFTYLNPKVINKPKFPL